MPRHDKIAGSLNTPHESRSMDNEHINAIGSLLADLNTRTGQLRGYL